MSYLTTSLKKYVNFWTGSTKTLHFVRYLKFFDKFWIFRLFRQNFQDNANWQDNYNHPRQDNLQKKISRFQSNI